MARLISSKDATQRKFSSFALVDVNCHFLDEKANIAAVLAVPRKDSTCQEVPARGRGICPEGPRRRLFYLFNRITLFSDVTRCSHSSTAILASRKTASIASGTVPPRSQWKPLSKSVPHF